MMESCEVQVQQVQVQVQQQSGAGTGSEPGSPMPGTLALQLQLGEGASSPSPDQSVSVSPLTLTMSHSHSHSHTLDHYSAALALADSRKRPLDADSDSSDVKRSHFSSGELSGSHHHHHHHHLHHHHRSSDGDHSSSSSPSPLPSDILNTMTTGNGQHNAETSMESRAGGDATYNLKTLVPSVATGAIMGKSGETILQLQKETGAKIKMSKTRDFYPGTTERICLITGSVEAIMTVMDFIMDKIREKPDLTSTFTEGDSKAVQERDKQVKILVPNSTAGMIIGKGGNYIKQIKETTGSNVQISQKAKDLSLHERCITVTGDKECNKRALMMILAKVVEDPASGVCLNISYAEFVGPVANFNPTGSPYAQNQTSHPFSSSTASLNSAGISAVPGAAGVLVNGNPLNSLNLTLNLAVPQATNRTLNAHIVDQIKLLLRNAGYSEAGLTEIITALGLLAKHAILGPGLTPLPTSGSISNALPYFPLSAEQSATASVFGSIGQVGLGNTSPSTRSSLECFAPDVAFDHSFRQSAVAPISINNNSFGLGTGGGAPGQGLIPLSKSPTPGDLGAKESKNVEIPEVIVGAILGPGGRNLIEIQHRSGANIQISKKGVFAPGTRNRIVTISGSSNAIATAHYFIQHRITEEEAKRSHQNTLSGIMQ